MTLLKSRVVGTFGLNLLGAAQVSVVKIADHRDLRANADGSLHHFKSTNAGADDADGDG